MRVCTRILTHTHTHAPHAPTRTPAQTHARTALTGRARGAQDGIFRLAAPQEDMRAVKRRLNAGGEVACRDVNVLANLLKVRRGAHRLRVVCAGGMCGWSCV